MSVLNVSNETVANPLGISFPIPDCNWFIYLFIYFNFKEEDILPKETKQEGAVSMNTYLQYFKSLHSLGAALFVIFLFVVTQVCILMSHKTELSELQFKGNWG